MNITTGELFGNLTSGNAEFQPLLLIPVVIAWYVINSLFSFRIARRLGMQSAGYAFIPVFFYAIEGKPVDIWNNDSRSRCSKRAFFFSLFLVIFTSLGLGMYFIMDKIGQLGLDPATVKIINTIQSFHPILIPFCVFVILFWIQNFKIVFRVCSDYLKAFGKVLAIIGIFMPAAWLLAKLICCFINKKVRFLSEYEMTQYRQAVQDMRNNRV